MVQKVGSSFSLSPFKVCRPFSVWAGLVTGSPHYHRPVSRCHSALRSLGRWSASFQDFIGSAEDAPGRTVGNRFASQPALDVSACFIGTGQAKRFAYPAWPSLPLPPLPDCAEYAP